MKNGPIKVLVIDNNKNSYTLINDLLSPSGEEFQLRWTDNYHNENEAISQGHYDIIFLDYGGDNHSCLGLLKEIKQKDHGRPLILLSENDNHEIAIESMNEGAANFLVKNQINKNILERSIRYAIKHHATINTLQKNEQRYALAIEGANQGVWDWDLRKNVIFFSSLWKSMIGFDKSEIDNGPQEWFDRIHPDDIEDVKNIFNVHRSNQISRIEIEYRIRHKNNFYRWVLIRGIVLRDTDGRAYRIIGSQMDINKNKTTEGQLLQDALYDSLTGLPKRTLFLDRLSHLLSKAKRDKNYLFAVLFIDIDRFKLINDTFGHLLGDQLLNKISKRLKKCLRLSDTVAHPGGDEFIILIDDIEDVNAATQVAERIQKEFHSPFNISGQNIFLTASIGIALNTPEYKKPENLLRDADTAMYQAKKQGKAGYKIFKTDMHVHAMVLLQLEADLRHAVKYQKFIIHYQPIISLATGQIIRMEALLRWLHPTQGVILPGNFIPLAEETGLILPIEEWVLGTVCTQYKNWMSSVGVAVPIAVNFSAQQFHRESLPQLIKKTLGKTNTPAHDIELEITESIAMKDVDFSIRILNELIAMNIKISIDDFGTGYSSLSCLKLFPIDAIKIDRSFLRDIPVNSNHTAITKAIIAMAHSLKLKVVAEGVETQAQLEFLLEHNCDEAQGFFFSYPLPPEKAIQFLREKNKLQ